MNATINTFISEASIIMKSLHFLRADWFYAFIPLIIYLLLLYISRSDNRNWNSVVDVKLMPFVLSRTNGKQRRYPLLLVFIAASLCITALAGPVYKKLPQPVFREQSSLVVLLDLSQSMNAADIKPSRLARARLELLDLLKTRKTGQTALIVYAADAFVVTPLTDDNTTIANLVPSLETDMMPAQGSNLSAALSKAFSLFTQSGVVKGDILVITDDIHTDDENAIKKLASQGYRLSVFGIGTTSGGPIPLAEDQGGGFLQDSSGAIVIPKLQPGKLQRFALSGNGLYSPLYADDSDINKLTRLFQSSAISADKEAGDNGSNPAGMNADIWQEEGHWLLFPLLFFAALWARKGWVAAVLPFTVLFLFQLPQTAYADTGNNNKALELDTDNLWLRPDQKAMRSFTAGDNQSAAREFTLNDWKASAFYRNGDYQAAADALKNTQNSDGFYNRGNALAMLGKYSEALTDYEKAIELDKTNTDAIYNKQQVQKALQEQQNQQQSQQQDQENQDHENQDQQSDKQQEQSSGEQKAGEQDENNSDKQNNEPSPEEQSSDDQTDKQKSEQNRKTPADAEQQKKAEQEMLKQRDAEAEKKQQQEEQQQYQQQQDAEKNNEIENREGKEKPAEIEVNPVEASISEEEKATEQWLKRIPDDPGGLLRRKFYYQYKQAPNQNDDSEPW